jgi:hypothetical protein
MSNLGNYGLSLFGMDPYGSESALFGVAGATSYSPHFVQVRFTDIIDLTDGSFTDPSNYNISSGLGVHAVIIESADSVILETDAQSFTVYTVTVTAARSFFGIPMVPPNNTATFTGFPSVSGYFSVGTTPTRIRCIFSNPMTVNAALTNPSSYAVSDLNGNALPVLSAQPEQTGNPLSVVLTLGVPMQTTQWYQTTISPTIIDINGQEPRPAAVDFQWVLTVDNVTIPITEFTGEVEGGPFGDPDGLVFFSPSLNVAAPNSTIQVEDVSVCTIAYDQYTFPPQVPDPLPFFVWSTIGPQTTLGEPGVVLYGGFPSLGEASFTLGFTPTHLFELMPEAFDGSCSVTLKQTFAPSVLIALLNDPAYFLYNDITSVTPPTFVCADNSVTPPPGSETIIVLRMALVGNSTMTVQEPSLVHWVEVNIQANSTLTTSPTLAPTNIAANSFMRVGRPNLVLGASVSIEGSSSLAIKSPQVQQASASIVGYAIVDAHCKQKWQANVTILGNSSIFTRPSRHQHISATPTGSSSMTGTATKGPVANAAIVAGSSATAHGTINHPASASLSGHSSVSASGT